MKWVTSAAPTVMAGLVWGFFCQEGFRIFFASSLFQGSAVWSQIEARSWPSIPWQRETAMAGALSRPKPPEAGAEGPPLRGPAIAENRPPRSVGRLAIAPAVPD